MRGAPEHLVVGDAAALLGVQALRERVPRRLHHRLAPAVRRAGMRARCAAVRRAWPRGRNGFTEWLSIIPSAQNIGHAIQVILAQIQQ
jgi:hypothetical protein